MAKDAIRYEAAVEKLHEQKADDRCWMDIDDLFVVFGLPQTDRHVGDKAAMLRNCQRFIERDCIAGKWPTYAELEKQIVELKEYIAIMEANHAVSHPDKT